MEFNKPGGINDFRCQTVDDVKKIVATSIKLDLQVKLIGSKKFYKKKGFKESRQVPREGL